MGISFRKSYKIGKNTRVNVSEHGGVGISTGFKGLRFSKNKKGTRLTIGGDGILYTKHFGKKTKDGKKDKEKEIEYNEVIVINPEDDFEKIPTENDHLLLVMLGNKEKNFRKVWL